MTHKLVLSRFSCGPLASHTNAAQITCDRAPPVCYRTPRVCDNTPARCDNMCYRRGGPGDNKLSRLSRVIPRSPRALWRIFATAALYQQVLTARFLRKSAPGAPHSPHNAWTGVPRESCRLPTQPIRRGTRPFPWDSQTGRRKCTSDKHGAPGYNNSCTLAASRCGRTTHRSAPSPRCTQQGAGEPAHQDRPAHRRGPVP